VKIGGKVNYQPPKVREYIEKECVITSKLEAQAREMQGAA
jgi:hypothetical protein